MRDRAFGEMVLRVVRRIPPGRVATYGDVAALAGSPRAARAVGNIMRRCDDPSVACYRVVGAGGTLGGYGGREMLKRALLRAEGILVVGRRVRNFQTVRWERAYAIGGCAEASELTVEESGTAQRNRN